MWNFEVLWIVIFLEMVKNGFGVVLILELVMVGVEVVGIFLRDVSFKCSIGIFCCIYYVEILNVKVFIKVVKYFIEWWMFVLGFVLRWCIYVYI